MQVEANNLIKPKKPPSIFFAFLYASYIYQVVKLSVLFFCYNDVNILFSFMTKGKVQNAEQTEALWY